MLGGSAASNRPAVSTAQQTLPVNIMTPAEMNNKDQLFTCGQTVRTFGRLMEYRIHDNMMTLSFENQSVSVNTELLGVFDYRIGSQYQAYGEMDLDYRGCYVMKARILRNVDGMDLKTYSQVVKQLKSTPFNF